MFLPEQKLRPILLHEHIPGSFELRVSFLHTVKMRGMLPIQKESEETRGDS